MRSEACHECPGRCLSLCSIWDQGRAATDILDPETTERALDNAESVLTKLVSSGKSSPLSLLDTVLTIAESGMSAAVSARGINTDRNRGLDMCRQCFREKVSYLPIDMCTKLTI